MTTIVKKITSADNRRSVRSLCTTAAVRIVVHSKPMLPMDTIDRAYNESFITSSTLVITAGDSQMIMKKTFLKLADKVTSSADVLWPASLIQQRSPWKISLPTPVPL